jgi:hypothetical protein
MCWFEAEVQATDLERLYLIGSSDLREIFGSYRLSEIARTAEGNDRFNHMVRIRGLVADLRRGRTFERAILVAESGEGPFVIIDGNHRCLAYHCEQCLAGQAVYLGMATDLISRYAWARQALAGKFG